MSLTKNFTQGGQVTLHNLRMIRQVMSVTVVSTLLITVAFLLCKSWSSYSPYQRTLIGTYLVATVKTELPLGDAAKKTQTFVFENGRTQVVRSVDLLNNPWVKQRMAVIKWTAFHDLVQAMWVLILSFVLFTWFWIWQGRARAKKEILSGTEVVSARALKRQICNKGEASDLKLAGVPLLKNKELQHMLIVGTTGSGKTNCIHELLQQIRTRKQRAVIVDVTGCFIEKYYRPGIDKILNPLDARSEQWTLWSDCHDSFHFESLASAFLPAKNEDEFWITSARTLFVAAAKKLEATKSIRQFLDKTILEPMNKVWAFYEETAAAAFMNEKADKTCVGVRSTLAANIKSLELLKDTATPFSIRQWMRDEKQQGWLFLASTPEMREELKPLITAWTSIATKALMSLAPSPERRIWFVIDELPALKKLPDFHTMLAEARKYGGCVIVGSQDMSLLDEVYGYNLVKSMANLCSTKVVFRIAGADIADRVSKWLGTQEVSEMIENISYGAHQMRDGVSSNDQRREKPAISPDKLTKLAALEGYIKLPGDYPIAQIKFKFHDLPKVAETVCYEQPQATQDHQEEDYSSTPSVKY